VEAAMTKDQHNELTIVPINRDRLRLGVRIALEEMVLGRNYARVEDILRALAAESVIGERLAATPR
jgi:hypothetical protein